MNWRPDVRSRNPERFREEKAEMKDDISQEVGSAPDEDCEIVEPGQGSITINREGSGHTLNVHDTIGTMILGIISLVLLWALLRSEARNREMHRRLSGTNEQNNQSVGE